MSETDRSPGEPPTLAIEGALATITLRRPQLANRLELADLELLLAQVGTVNATPGVRVLKLCATGRHFCSGFNLGQVGAAAGHAVQRFEALADALELARPVTVAQIQGGAYGGAVDLAVACDFRFATTDCEMMVPAVKLGLHFYRGGMERLVTRLGLGAAKRLLLAAERLDARELQQLGVLDQVLAPDSLPAEVQSFCDRLAGLAPLALLPMKQHLNRIARGALDAAALTQDLARSLASDDLQEGSRAWNDKRPPQFLER